MLDKVKELGITRKPGVFHMHIYRKLLEKANGTPVMRKKEVFQILSNKMYKENYYSFLKEMEECGLIRITDWRNVELLQKQDQDP